jgi:hypothetical protein
MPLRGNANLVLEHFAKFRAVPANGIFGVIGC